MKSIEITLPNGETHIQYLFDTEKDKCPLCDTPLKNTYGSWNMFHGEITRNCCNSPWQTKDFYVDDQKKPAYAEYFAELNKPNIHSLSIDHELWKPLRNAFAEVGVKDCRNKRVYELVKPILEKLRKEPEAAPASKPEGDSDE